MSSITYSNLPEIFLWRSKLKPKRPALFYKNKSTQNFVSISWEQWRDRVQAIALALFSIGIRKGSRVAILSENRPEWAISDLGILSLGAVVVPIYATSSEPDIAYVLKHSGAEILMVSCREQLQRIQSVLSELDKKPKIILFDDDKDALFDEGVLFLDLLEVGRLGRLNNPKLYTQLLNEVKREDLATLIYTSGTTGPPKGVMLSHGNFMANCRGSSEKIQVSESDIAMSFLPLSHVFERMAGYYFMILHGAQIAYAENMQTVAEDMQKMKPTVAAAVPRFYEKVYGRILESVESGPLIRQKIFNWAVSVGRERCRNRHRKGIDLGFILRYCLARLLVFKKLEKRLGGRMRFFISGGAPLAKELGEFFYAANIQILEGYGLTETSPVISVNTLEDFQFGTVGKPLSNAEVKIAEDGEILTRGECVMQGYYENPVATQEAIQDGWFHTGDIGKWVDGKRLKITDRKKDIIVTSGGKNVAPQNIEGLLIQDVAFSQAVVVGDKRNFLVALIVPSKEAVQQEAQTLGLASLSWDQLLENQKIHDWLDTRMKARVSHLASFEQIKYFALLSEELSIEKGELTPTLKVKRKKVVEKYKDKIDALYANATAPSSSVTKSDG